VSRACILSLAILAGCGAAHGGAVGKTETCPCRSAPAASVDAGSATSAKPKDLDTIASELLPLINANDGAGVEALFADSMRKAFPIEKTGPFVARLIDKGGRLESLLREPGVGNDHHGVYRFKAERVEWRVELAIDDAGRIVAFGVTAAPTDTPVPKSTIELVLPYRGQWSVFWGGDTPALNAHVSVRNQMRAADLVVVDADGKTYRGDGKVNADYFAYGKEILAVADGVVAMIVDGIPENEPGEMNRYFVPGNVVVVKHANDVFSVYAHLQPGKFRVKKGAAVKRGAVLGLCGNSGNASEPHLHFQLQDGIGQDKSSPIEPVFKNVEVVRDGKSARFAEYTFRKGDLVGDNGKK
jgi:murein DD-endopeptidase MepM/ murein hydrolase activator NlpD